MEYLFTECETMIPQYVATELRSKAISKYPERAALALEFLEELGASAPDADGTNPEHVTIRDPKDQPILDAAILHNVDIIISGDKDFRSLHIVKPRIMSPAEFIAEFIPELD